jgi:hypothetical protein
MMMMMRYTCLDLNEMMKFCKREDTFAAILFHEVLLFCHKMVAMSVASWI